MMMIRMGGDDNDDDDDVTQSNVWNLPDTEPTADWNGWMV